MCVVVACRPPCHCLAVGCGRCGVGTNPEHAPLKIALIRSLSGLFAITGEAVFRNLLWATERVNARGDVKPPGGARALAMIRCDLDNWGNGLTLLIKAARDVGYDGKFRTLCGNALDVPAALANAGLGKVIAVAEWFPNAPDAASAASYQSFCQRFVQPQDD